MQPPTLNFRFPSLCARCGRANPEEKWLLMEDDTPHGSTAAVIHTAHLPICAPCSAVLSRGYLYTLLAGLGGLAAGVATMRLLAYLNWAGPWTSWGDAVVVGILGAIFGVIIGRWLGGTYFAAIASGGATIHFTNQEVQAEFDRLNPR